MIHKYGLTCFTQIQLAGVRRAVKRSWGIETADSRPVPYCRCRGSLLGGPERIQRGAFENNIKQESMQCLTGYRHPREEREVS